jgi:cytochrome c556
MRSNHSIAVFAFACAGVVAAATLSAGPAEPVRPRATVQELMDTRIDPAADALWDSVAFIASEKGEEDRRPRTPAEWAAVRQNAMALIEGAADLGMPGRRVSAVEAAPGPGELRASEIQHLIEADPAAFAKRAYALQAATRAALAAINSKDADGLMNAGGIIDAACEACHIVYWYPKQLQAHK